MASSRLCYYLLSCIVVWTLVNLVWCQTRPQTAADALKRNSTCKAGMNCSACIQMEGCAWCVPNEITDEDVATCQSEGTLCVNGTIVSPKGKATGPGNSAPAQNEYNMAITTDISRLSLRVGEPQRVEMTLKVSPDGLLDLYYLTDLSDSMSDDLKQLRNAGDKLVTAMQEKTNNFKIGFGTFIDKKLFPSFDIFDNSGTQPKDSCQKKYSFCNSMALTEDGKETFLNTVGNATTGENKDLPEGGLDALMQVLVCETAIGWRKNALKIVLYASDDAFHYAGDGKLAGIDKINDGKCHLDGANKYYTEGLKQDYPSVAQIIEAANKNNIHVIFAVVEGVLELYKMLAELVPGFTSTRLASDSSNVINIVTEEFEKISETLELTAESSREVDVTFVYDCPSGSPDKCEGLKKDQSYKVTAEITLRRCPADLSSGTQRLVLNAVGLNENVTIDLDYICSCDCEKPENVQVMSPKCNNTGTYTCGLCKCPDGVYGTTCGCAGDVRDNSAACTVQGQSTPCSGQGQCMCRRCECNQGYYGQLCECADKGCILQGGKECNGHGDCKCKNCNCHAGWTGDSCNCSTENTQCYRKDSNEQCSGHGVCECNSCQCDLTGHGEDKYFGKYCHDCPTCGGECSNLKTCVLCHLFAQKDKVNSGVDEPTCEASLAVCASANISHVADESKLNTSSYSKCPVQVDHCTRIYFYRRQTDMIQVVLVGEWNCPLRWWEILLAVVVPMVILGLLSLIIWYCIHEHKLKMEMIQFEKDAAAAVNFAARENDLYRNPVSHMQNPLFDTVVSESYGTHQQIRVSETRTHKETRVSETHGTHQEMQWSEVRKNVR